MEYSEISASFRFHQKCLENLPHPDNAWGNIRVNANKHKSRTADQQLGILLLHKRGGVVDSLITPDGCNRSLKVAVEECYYPWKDLRRVHQSSERTWKNFFIFGSALEELAHLRRTVDTFMAYQAS